MLLVKGSRGLPAACGQGISASWLGICCNPIQFSGLKLLPAWRSSFSSSCQLSRFPVVAVPVMTESAPAFCIPSPVDLEGVKDTDPRWGTRLVPLFFPVFRLCLCFEFPDCWLLPSAAKVTGGWGFLLDWWLEATWTSPSPPLYLSHLISFRGGQQLKGFICKDKYFLLKKVIIKEWAFIWFLLSVKNTFACHQIFHKIRFAFPISLVPASLRNARQQNRIIKNKTKTVQNKRRKYKEVSWEIETEENTRRKCKGRRMRNANCM